MKDDKEILEDMIVASINQAQGKIDQLTQEKMGSISGGMPSGFPGL